MALKDSWVDKKDEVDYILAEDINAIARGVIDIEENLPKTIEEKLGEAKESGEFDGKDGLSAYELAIKNGTTTAKSEAEWLASLKGTDGRDGVDGVDGKDGYTPKKGVDYFDGEDGKDGKDGASVGVHSVSESHGDGDYNVVTFTDGKALYVKNGKTGARGEKGATGEAGVSATHSWDGTKLFISSASGTSYADLKGEKGDKGDKGDVGSTPDLLYHYLVDGNVIMPETAVTFDSKSGAYLMDKYTLTVGKEYFVITNGVKTKATAVECDGGVKLEVATGDYDAGTYDSYRIECYDTVHWVNGSYCYTMISNAFRANASATIAILDVDYKIDPRYIPNMYYEEGELVEVLPETKLTAPNPEVDPGVFLIEENYPELVIGTTYKVIWNGVEYAGTAFDASSMGFEGAVALINDGGDLNTGEGVVFLIVYAAGEGFMLTDLSLATELTVSIFAEDKTIHHIPPKYIKDMYYEEETYGEIVPLTTAIDNGYAQMGELYVMGPPITLVVGKTYKVNYNGVEYECVATAGEVQGESMIAMGDLAVLTTGTPSGAYPFVIATGAFVETAGASIAVIGLDGSASITVAIYGDKTEIHGIPQKYIDGYAPMFVGDRVLFSDEIQDVTDSSDLFNFITMNRHRNKIRMRCGGPIGDGIFTFERVNEDYGCLFMCTYYHVGLAELHNLIIKLFTGVSRTNLYIHDKII